MNPKNLKTAIKRSNVAFSVPEKTFEILLGGKDKLIDFSAFYEKNKDELGVLQEYYLREFNEHQIYSKEDNVSFRKGLQCSFEFLRSCYDEKNSKGQGENLTPDD